MPGLLRKAFLGYKITQSVRLCNHNGMVPQVFWRTVRLVQEIQQIHAIAAAARPEPMSGRGYLYGVGGLMLGTQLHTAFMINIRKGGKAA
jgi:hypothetical protein